MNDIRLYLPTDLGWPNIAAIGLIFALWGFYSPILRLIGRGSLMSQLHTVRLRCHGTNHAVSPRATAVPS